MHSRDERGGSLWVKLKELGGEIVAGPMEPEAKRMIECDVCGAVDGSVEFCRDEVYRCKKCRGLIAARRRVINAIRWSLWRGKK